VAALHGAFRVPIKQIRRLLQELWGLRISEGVCGSASKRGWRFWRGRLLADPTRLTGCWRSGS
jgi:hypothetical protein